MKYEMSKINDRVYFLDGLIAITVGELKLQVLTPSEKTEKRQEIKRLKGERDKLVNKAHRIATKQRLEELDKQVSP